MIIQGNDIVVMPTKQLHHWKQLVWITFWLVNWGCSNDIYLVEKIFKVASSF